MEPLFILPKTVRRKFIPKSRRKKNYDKKLWQISKANLAGINDFSCKSRSRFTFNFGQVFVSQLFSRSFMQTLLAANFFRLGEAFSRANVKSWMMNRAENVFTFAIRYYFNFIHYILVTFSFTSAISSQVPLGHKQFPQTSRETYPSCSNNSKFGNFAVAVWHFALIFDITSFTEVMALRLNWSVKRAMTHFVCVKLRQKLLISCLLIFFSPINDIPEVILKRSSPFYLNNQPRFTTVVTLAVTKKNACKHCTLWHYPCFVIVWASLWRIIFLCKNRHFLEIQLWCQIL